MNIIKKNDKRLNDVIDTIIQKNDKLQTGFAAVKIKDIYQKTMGEVVNKYTTSIKLRRNTLFLEITSAPLKNELMHSSEKFRTLLNEHLGSEIIKKIVIR